MAGEKDRVEGYLATVDRLEPVIHPIDADAFYASAAISLKRIADAADIANRLEAIKLLASGYGENNLLRCGLGYLVETK